MIKFNESLLIHLSKSTSKGYYGSEAAAQHVEYRNTEDGFDAALKYAKDFFRYRETYEGMTIEETRQCRDYFCQILMVIFRDAKKRDELVAKSFIASFVEDYPGCQGSALLSRWNALAEASYSFRTTVHGGDRILLWQQASRLFLAYNEFINGLLGFMIVGWRCAQGKSVNPNVINNNYGSKLNELAQLTNGEDGVFYLFFRIAQPKLRNGIAHGSAWLDSETGTIRYLEGQRQKTERSMGLFEFSALLTLGTHLGAAYIAALSAIVVYESGRPRLRSRLPRRWRKLLRA